VASLSGWGRFPTVEGESLGFGDAGQLARLIEAGEGIPFGLGRSYGDSALAQRCFASRHFDRFLAFDESTGVLRAQAGVSLAEILRIAIPRGWFLPVTPGTAFVTLGGAVASDVHGKNHHLEGCFCDHVSELSLMTADGEILRCSPSENLPLFRATCGGMGLTGVILEVTLRMKPIRSAWIDETLLRIDNLEELFAGFETHAQATYSVAWIDCLAKGDKLGRSLLMVGEHAQQGDLSLASPGRMKVPMDAPGFALNHFTVAAFNTLYYQRVRRKVTQHRVHYAPYFYPLDAVGEWNRLYGKRGFLQYQCVIPKAAGLAGMRGILGAIADSGLASFLAVLKAFGKGNDNLISFPMEGYTLALDFAMHPRLKPLLDRLDAMVLDHGGRVYLTKDARMSPETFRKGYPGLDEFLEVRTTHGGDRRFHSLQSRRLEIP
jgi:FAD/FMN-containing dehydrogenase